MLHHNVFSRMRFLAPLALAALLVALMGRAPATRAAPNALVYMPVVLGAHVATPAEIAVARVNHYRSLAGVAPVTLDPALAAAAQRHATYTVLNDGDASAWTGGPHGEVAGKPGFSGQTPGDRVTAAGFSYPVSAEVIDYVGDPQHSVDDLMATVFHRVGLLLPWSRFAGYGLDHETAAAFDVLDFGRGADAPALSPGVVVFPAPGQTDVPLVGWDEQPSAVPPGAPYPFGYHVTIQPTTGSGLTVTTAELRDGTGALVAVYPSPAACGVTCYALTPIAPLHPATTYIAHTAGTIDGVAFALTWSFTTGACADPVACAASARSQS